MRRSHPIHAAEPSPPADGVRNASARRLVVLFALGLGCAAGGPAGTGGPMPDMVSPKRLVGERAELDAYARRLGLYGKMIARCIITRAGEVTNCRVIAPANPGELEREVLSMLQQWRYQPATFKGEPVAVDYVFNLDFKNPNAGPRPPER